MVVEAMLVCALSCCRNFCGQATQVYALFDTAMMCDSLCFAAMEALST